MTSTRHIANFKYIFQFQDLLYQNQGEYQMITFTKIPTNRIFTLFQVLPKPMMVKEIT